jgi:aerobic carbon-monoxide dehydrogenase large subunit
MTGSIGDEKATNDAFAKAANVVSLDLTNNRLVPNAMEPRAAVAEYDPAEEHFTLYTTSQNPHVARLVLSAFYNVAQEHKLRVSRPRRRRRLRVEDLHLSRRDGRAVGVQEGASVR